MTILSAVLMGIAILCCTFILVVLALVVIHSRIVRIDDRAERMEDTLERLRARVDDVHLNMSKDEGYGSRLELDRRRQDAMRHVGLGGLGGLGRGPGLE